MLDVKMVFVKFWTGRVPDHDVELFLNGYCTILQPAVKLVDKFGIWCGVRKYKVHKTTSGQSTTIPNSISLDPYNGKISYPGKNPRCYICQGLDNHVKDCPEVKCWRCGDLRHKSRVCESTSKCTLCVKEGLDFFKCPQSYAYKVRVGPQSSPEEEPEEETRDRATDNEFHRSTGPSAAERQVPVNEREAEGAESKSEGDQISEEGVGEFSHRESEEVLFGRERVSLQY